MNNSSERHHYIPKFYAKGFLGEDKKFYVYDKTKDEIKKKKVSPKEVFYEWSRNTISSENREYGCDGRLLQSFRY